MKLLVNNKTIEVEPNGTLVAVIEQFGASGAFAVAHNGQFVSQQDYATTTLNTNDKVEILSPIAGG
ncbi:MAG: sulfur carrier protein [Phenylobacterium sp.]